MQLYSTTADRGSAMVAAVIWLLVVAALALGIGRVGGAVIMSARAASAGCTATTACATASVLKSAATRAVANLDRSRRGASRYPTRSPGKSAFENVPT